MRYRIFIGDVAISGGKDEACRAVAVHAQVSICEALAKLGRVHSLGFASKLTGECVTLLSERSPAYSLPLGELQ